ncbi:MAG: beta strand repeat-containing protein, partial [Planctomyces sp.]
ITAGTGSVTFTGAVGATIDLGDITIVSALDVTFSSTLAADSFTQSAGTGDTQFDAAVTINSASAVDVAITTNTVTINGTITTSNGGSVTITNAGVLDIAPGADMTLDGLFLQDGAGAVQTAGDITTTNDNITFTRAVAMTDSHAVVFNTGAGAGDVLFTSTLNGTTNYSEDVTVSAGTGNITFGNPTAAVGALVPLRDLIANSSGTTLFSSTVMARSLTTNAGGNTTLNGNVTTTQTQTYNDALRIDATLTLQTTSGGNIVANNTVDAGSDAPSESLTLNSGTTGTVNVNSIIDVNGIVGGVAPLFALIIANSNGADFAAAITTETTADPDTDTTRSVQILASAGNGGGGLDDANLYFRGAIISNAILASSGASVGYNLYIYGNGTNVREGVLQNDGILEFGDNSSDSLIFRNGITATGQYQIFLLGTPQTYGTPVTLGDIDTTVYVYTGTTIIDTTLNGNPDGANITFGGSILGQSGAGGENLTLRAGTDGDIVVGLIAGSSGNRMGNILIESANDVTLNAVTAQSLVQSTGTNSIAVPADVATTTLNGDVNTNTSTGVALTTVNIVVNAVITTTSAGVVSLLANAGAETALTGIIILNDGGRIVSSGVVTLTGDRTIAPSILIYESSPAGANLVGQTRDFITTNAANAHVVITSSIAFFSPGETANNNF